MSDFTSILSDLSTHQRRLQHAKYLELVPEMRNNLLPFLQSLVEQIDERFIETESQLAALIEGGDSILQPELASQILLVFDLARTVFEKIEPTVTDELKQAILAFKALADNVANRIIEVTIEVEEAGDDEEDEDDEVLESATSETSEPLAVVNTNPVTVATTTVEGTV